MRGLVPRWGRAGGLAKSAATFIRPHPPGSQPNAVEDFARRGARPPLGGRAGGLAPASRTSPYPPRASFVCIPPAANVPRGLVPRWGVGPRPGSRRHQGPLSHHELHSSVYLPQPTYRGGSSPAGAGAGPGARVTNVPLPTTSLIRLYTARSQRSAGACPPLGSGWGVAEPTAPTRRAKPLLQLFIPRCAGPCRHQRLR